jgi:hypothetical protein
MKSIHNLIEHEPTMIAPGHGRPYPVDKSTMAATEQHLRQQQQFFFDILREGETDFGMDPSWVRIYPYQILIGPGEQKLVRINVQNYSTNPMKIEVGLVVPSEWRIEPDVVKFEVPAKSTSHRSVMIRLPQDWAAPNTRFAIAADVVRDGKYLGQITEAVVDMKGSQSF